MPSTVGESPTFPSQHAVCVDSLPALHKDPFDRMLVAQSLVEGVVLLTSGRMVAQTSLH